MSELPAPMTMGFRCKLLIDEGAQTSKLLHDYLERRVTRPFSPYYVVGKRYPRDTSAASIICAHGLAIIFRSVKDGS